MQKISNSTSTANGAGEYTQGQPGSGIDATLITPAWLNAVQRELVNVIIGAGIPLDPNDDAQVLKAIQAIQTTASTWAKLTGKPTTVSGFGITDAFTKTETTTTIQQAVAALVASSPAALDTLKELADALGNDPNFATTITNALSEKASIASIQSQGATAFTTAGTAPAFTLTPVPAIAGYAAPLRFRVKFNAAAPTGGTLNVSGRGPKNLKQYDSAGIKVSAVIALDMLTDVEYDGTDLVLLDPLPPVTSVDPWLMQPIGVPIPVFDHLAGAPIPSTTAAYRYIKLTAADAYNAGVLTSESVTGSAPLVLATATINLSGSPINGLSVSLINTERRSVRAGSSGTLQNHQMQGHVHGVLQWSTAAGGLAGGGSIGYYTGSPTGSPITDGTNGAPLVGDENRSKNIGATYYMRIK
ncbi:hypothetical protein [Pseudomonas hormoni]